MTLNQFARTTLLGVVMVTMTVGCAKDGKKTPTQREAARAQWNTARATVLRSLAEDQYRNGDLDNSRKTVDDALRLDPTSVPLRLLSAKLFIETGELELATKQLDAVRLLDQTNAEADYLTGLVFQRWQQPKMALMHYDTAAEKNPNEMAYVLARAEMMVALDRTDDAVKILRERSSAFEHSATLRHALGQILMQQEKYDQAVDVLRQASILATDEPQIREHLALALYYDKQYAQANDAFARLTRVEPYASRPDLLSAMGECQMAMGRLPDARALFEKVTQLDAGNAKAWLNLAKVALQMNDLPRADLSLRKAVALEPNHAETQLMLGSVRMQQGRLEDALRAFDRASQLDPLDSTPLVMKGYALHEMGRHGEAMQHYARALKLKPDDELAAKLLAGVNVSE